MENIESILKTAGVELTAEQAESVKKGVSENYKPIADYDKQKAKVDNLTEQLKTATDSLKQFEGIDAAALNGKIDELTKALSDKAAEYDAAIKERDFMDSVKGAIGKAKGKDADMIVKLLDLDTLRTSQNRDTDIANAIKALAEADMTKGMFDTEPAPTGRSNPIGGITNPKAGADYISEKYKNNPYYHK